MWLLAHANATLHSYPQSTYILVATLATAAFMIWCYVSCNTVPPESRRIAAFIMVCAHLFVYNVFLLLERDTGQHVWGCVFVCVLILCLVMVWPLPPEYGMTPEEEDEYYRELP